MKGNPILSSGIYDPPAAVPPFSRVSKASNQTRGIKFY
jgi:hypothetical protein